MADVSYDLKAAKKGESYTTLLNSADPLDNLITIDGVDYYMGYLDENIEGNKGGNSYIYKLYPVTEYDNVVTNASKPIDNGQQVRLSEKQ